MSEGIWTMPFAHFTCSTGAVSGKRSVYTIFTYQFPVWCKVLRTTASEPIETCIVNSSNTVVVPINNPTGGTQVAGINVVPGSQEASPSGVVLYEARERALALACVGYEIRFGYEVDDNGVPVPKRTRR